VGQAEASGSTVWTAGDKVVPGSTKEVLAILSTEIGEVKGSQSIDMASFLPDNVAVAGSTDEDSGVLSTEVGGDAEGSFSFLPER
jgi:hypothetical protein